MIIVKIPSGFRNELSYVIDVIIGGFLGLQYSIDIVENLKNVELILANNARLEVETVLLAGANKRKFMISDIPTNVAYLSNKFIPEIDLPLLYGDDELIQKEDYLFCGIDIFSSVFFMLSRLEEFVSHELDEHQRFTSIYSVAHKNHFLNRPIIDEYVEMLWKMLESLDPAIERKRVKGQVFISCDVDAPFDYTSRSLKLFVIALLGDLVKRRSLLLFAKRILNVLLSKANNYKFDPYYTFDWYMEVCQKYTHKVAFYFLSDNTAGPLDGDYQIEDKEVLNLMKKIRANGHEIGTHGSYNTYHNSSQIKKEKSLLEEVTRKIDPKIEIKGNRQHYLRWDVKETPDHLDACGYQYDTSGGYADAPGFRYGTSKEFTMWSWKTGAPLRIKQRPLIVMECSVISDKYLGLGHGDDALNLMLSLRETALKYGGNFTLLWHNSHLYTAKDKVFFEKIVKGNQV